MPDVPILETNRLLLRGHLPGDLDTCLVLWNDPVVFAHISGKPSTREDCWKAIHRHHGQWHFAGFGFWLIEEKASGRHIGEAGFLDCKRDLVPSMDETPEVGWAMLPAFHGKGLAHEALTAILAWGDANIQAKTFACIIAPENTRSLNLATKLGFREVANTTYQGDPTLLLHRAIPAKSR